MSLFSELKRRNVFRVGLAYLISAWVIAQVASLVLNSIKAPDWVMQTLLLVLGLGFIIALIISWAYEITPEGIKKEKDVVRDESITNITAKKLDVITLVAAFGVFGLIGWQQINPPSNSATSPNSTDVIPAQAGIHSDIVLSAASIAVLPFADLSPDGDQEYFTDGISEELLNVLAQVKEMKVAGRTSSFSFKGKNMDLREIGRILGVATILEGSVRKQGEKVRITAQLIKADDGFHLWSENYDRDLSDIFAVQDEIALAISKALMPHLLGEQAPKVKVAQRTDVDAYKKFLEARQLVHGRTFDGFNRARDLLNEVMTTDPNYAPAYALQAQVSLHLSDAQGAYGQTPLAKALVSSYSLTEKALELDPALADAYAAQGLALAIDSKSEQAITAWRKALTFNPNHLDASMWLAYELTADRRYHDIVDTMQSIFDKDPLYGPIARNLMANLHEIGAYEQVQVIVDRLDAIDPNSIRTQETHSVLAYQQGRIGKATQIRHLIFEKESSPSNSSALASAYLDLGDPEKTREYGEPIFDFWASLIDADFNRAEGEMAALLEQSPNNAFLQNEYLRILTRAKGPEAALKFYSETWQDLRDFENKTFNAYSNIPPHFSALAYAYKAVGDEKNFAQVIQRWRSYFELNRAGGRISWRDDWQEAQLFILVDDPEGAIDVLNTAFERETILPVFVLGLMIDDNFRQSASFKALDAKNRKRLNEERAVLDLPPLPIEGSDK